MPMSLSAAWTFTYLYLEKKQCIAHKQKYGSNFCVIHFVSYSPIFKENYAHILCHTHCPIHFLQRFFLSYFMLALHKTAYSFCLMQLPKVINQKLAGKPSVQKVLNEDFLPAAQRQSQVMDKVFFRRLALTTLVNLKTIFKTS